MGTIEIPEMQEILPHRYPLLLVDRIIECDYKERIVGIKNVTFNEPFFQGHFPGNPIMPGVFQLEAMAQVGGILINRMLHREGKIAFFTSIDNARFRRMVIPGDQLRLEVTLKKMRLGIAKIRGEAFVDGQLVSEADMMFGTKTD